MRNINNYAQWMLVPHLLAFLLPKGNNATATVLICWINIVDVIGVRKEIGKQQFILSYDDVYWKWIDSN